MIRYRYIFKTWFSFFIKEFLILLNNLFVIIISLRYTYKSKGGRSMLKTIQIYFLLFMIYAVIGWFVEVTAMFLHKHRFINRGFLIGPYCPVYGYGALCMTLLLTKYQDDIFVLFGMSVLVCSILEYITSYIMEKLFKARWWDYSKKKFNLNGRICLSNAIMFGIGGVFIIFFVNPIILGFLYNNPKQILNIVTLILLVTYLIDNILSFKIIYSFKQTARTITHDSTEEISAKVRENMEEITNKAKVDMDLILQKINRTCMEATAKIRKAYAQKPYFHQRLLKAFPNFQMRASKPEKIAKEVAASLKDKQEK